VARALLSAAAMRFPHTARGRTAIAVATTLLALTMAPSTRADDLPRAAEEPPASGTPTSPPPPVAVEAQAPSPSPRSPEEAPPADEPPRKPKRASGLTGRLHGGLGQRKLLSDSLLGADLTASVGGYIESVSIFADLQVMFASDQGLPLRQYRIGPSLDVEVFSRMRLGAGLSAGGTTLTRTTTRKTMDAWSWGARIFASVDLFQLEGRTAVYLLGQLSVDTAGTFLGSDTRRAVPTVVMWGPTIGAGVRF